MKRFYCKVCKRVKRVQNWPTRKFFSSDIIPQDVTDRVAVCNHHPVTQSTSSKFTLPKGESNKATDKVGVA